MELIPYKGDMYIASLFSSFARETWHIIEETSTQGEQMDTITTPVKTFLKWVIAIGAVIFFAGVFFGLML